MLKDNLKILRESLNISQRELGKRIEMTGQYIAQIEKGQRNPTHATLEKIASKLDVELSELLERPKFICEFFLDRVNDKGISHEVLIKQFKLCDYDLRDIFLDPNKTNDNLLNAYYSIGEYLGFDAVFLERRKYIDPEIINSIHDSEKEYELIISLNNSYNFWVNEDIIFSFDFHEYFNHKGYFNHTKSIPSQNNFSLSDINNLFRSTLIDILKFAKSSTVIKYGLDDFTTDEIDELNNFVFNSFRLKIDEIIEKQTSSSLQKK